ncbi:MAG: hypothetical protein AAF772_13740 [Acidobacteriota bacterium]
MRNKVVLLGAAALLVAGLATAQLPAEKQAELQAAGITSWTPGQTKGSAPVFATLDNPLAAPAGTPPADTATMQYDDGMISVLPTLFGQIYGNRFSLGVGGVSLDTITLNSFSFFFLEDDLADTGLTFQISNPLNATSISALGSTNITGLANSGQSFSAPVLNTVPGTAIAAQNFNDTFFLGAWCLNANTAFPVDNEMLGLTNGGSQTRGYTADSAGSGPTPFAAQPFSAVLRANVTSPNAVPVELMNFDVDSDR